MFPWEYLVDAKDVEAYDLDTYNGGLDDAIKWIIINNEKTIKSLEP